MNRSHFVSPFPRFHLSDHDTAQLHKLAQTFIHTSLAQYDAFVLEQHSRRRHAPHRSSAHAVDTSVWKFVRERANLRAYTGRPTTSSSSSNSKDLASPSSTTTRSSFASQHRRSSVFESKPQASSPALDDMSVVLVVGAVAGSVDDMMYGLMSDSVDTARIKNSYVEDVESDVAVLATLTAPSVERPFESVVIKWAALEQPPLVRSVIKKRDFVYMEMTGTAELPSSRERVGYHLIHSLHFRQTPELRSCVRAHVSIATFCRARPGATAARRREVELCVKGVADPGGSMLRTVAVTNLAASLTSLWRNVDCAILKKLAWLMRCACHATATTARSHQRESASDSDDDDASMTSDHASRIEQQQRTVRCGTCAKAPVLAVTRDSRRRTCRICRQYVCSSCKIKKRMSVIDAATDKLERRDVAFCSTCVRHAVALSSFVVAQREVAARGSSSCSLASDDWGVSVSSSNASEATGSSRGAAR